jgi:hypothetical protein
MKLYNLVIITAVLIMMNYMIVARKMKHHDFKPDIIVSPCGLYGIYNMGICHYIRNHFHTEDKKIAGLSSGSFNAIFLCLDKKPANRMLKETFKLNNKYNNNIKKYAENIIVSMNKYFTIDDIKNKNLYIGLSHPNDLVFYHDFTTMDQLMKCCIGSSFIPGITYRNLIHFYNNKYAVDGAIWYRHYKKYIDTDKTLIISPKLFNRYGYKNLIYDSLFKKNFNLYQLYLNGYHDARKNHKYFTRFLRELNFTP